MKARLILFALLVGAAVWSQVASDASTAAPSAPSNEASSECRTLRAGLPTMEPMAALLQLEAFHRTHENEPGCEAGDLSQWMSRAEQRLVTLRDGNAELRPQLSLRCYEIRSPGAHCEGVEADDTALLNEHWFAPLDKPATKRLRVVSELKGAELLGVYVARPSDLREGKAARQVVVRQSEFSPGHLARGTVIIAVIRTPKEWSSWPYRKVVWMF